MQSPPLALGRVAALVPVVAFLRRTGAAVDRLLGRLDLPPFVFHSPEELIPLRQAVRFMEESARESGIQSLGTLAGRDSSVTALGVFGRLVRRQATLADAIATAARTMPAFSSGVRCRLTICGSRAELHPEFVDPYAGGSRQACEYLVTLIGDLVGLAQGTDGERASTVTANDVPTIVFAQSLLWRPLARRMADRAPNE